MKGWQHGGCCRGTAESVGNRRCSCIVAARGSGLVACCCRLRTSSHCPALCACRIAGPAAAVLASKCLKGKPATVVKTGEACMLLIELEQQAVVIEAVLKAFSDKVPKVVLAAVDIIAQAVRWAAEVRASWGLLLLVAPGFARRQLQPGGCALPGLCMLQPSMH